MSVWGGLWLLPCLAVDLLLAAPLPHNMLLSPGLYSRPLGCGGDAIRGNRAPDPVTHPRRDEALPSAPGLVEATLQCSLFP